MIDAPTADRLRELIAATPVPPEVEVEVPVAILHAVLRGATIAVPLSSLREAAALPDRKPGSIPDAEILDAMRLSRGYVTKAALILRTTPGGLKQRLYRSPELSQACRPRTRKPSARNREG